MQLQDRMLDMAPSVVTKAGGNDAARRGTRLLSQTNHAGQRLVDHEAAHLLPGHACLRQCWHLHQARLC